MHPEASRILANILVLLDSGLFRGKHCAAVPEARLFVENMIAEGKAKSEAQDAEA
jgi:hypothetical protein